MSKKEYEIDIPGTEFPEGEILLKAASKKSGIPLVEIESVRVLKRSIDSRNNVRWILKIQVNKKGVPVDADDFQFQWKDVSSKPEVLICGMGPAGMFAALRLIECGLKPVILERGKEIKGRRRDLALINKNGIVNSDSNYCFGEGGAGTFSDGKLYTRSLKRGNVKRILKLFEHFGASKDISIDSHPHIGTNKLPAIIEKMRKHILDCGGVIHFETRMNDVEIKDGKLVSVATARGDRIPCNALILATGHSARDIFFLLKSKKLLLEAKGFALGVRVEHPQNLIDLLQYHCSPRPASLPAASYALVSQVNNSGVFSFCMCPGGIICPAATGPEELVVNGWSPSKRNGMFSNSGIVTEIMPEDLAPFSEHKELAGLHFQMAVERNAYFSGGENLAAPATRLEDFVKGKVSASLPGTSYIPGLTPAEMQTIFPERIIQQLRGGFKEFGKKMRGYLSNDAVIVATESRTSSPVRIPRDKEKLMHPELAGLFPCGEGAGYAGGIVSAAMDGEKCAEAVATYLGIKVEL